MDGVLLALFCLAAFLGGFASGLAGFAMGFVVSGVWLHFLSPVETTALIVGYGLLTQGYGVFKLRRALDLALLAPFLAGSVVGVPLGTALLTYVDPGALRLTVGVLLVLYASYGLIQPKLPHAPPSAPADAGIGLANGVVAGLTGLPGFVITVWCTLRGWGKDLQRAVFQPVMLAAILLNLVSLTVAGAVTRGILQLYLIGLPAMLAGLWAGFRLYGTLDERAFRKLMLFMLMAAGIALIGAQLTPLLRAVAGR